MVSPYMVKQHHALVLVALFSASPLAAQQQEEAPANLAEQMREWLLEADALKDRFQALGDKLQAWIEQIEAEITDRPGSPEPPATGTGSIEATVPSQEAPSARLAEQMRGWLLEAEALQNQREVLDDRLHAWIEQIEAETIDRPELPEPPVTGTDSIQAAATPPRTAPRSSTLRATSVAPAMPPSPRDDAFSVRRQFAWADRSPTAQAQEKQAYLDALAYLERGGADGDYRQFRAMLQRFVSTYQGGPYEPKARYLIADSYYTEKQHERAARSFLLYIDDFPHDDRVDDARLKVAYIRHEQGEVAAAVRLLEQLSDSRNSRVRELAQRRLRLIAKDPGE